MPTLSYHSKLLPTSTAHVRIERSHSNIQGVVGFLSRMVVAGHQNNGFDEVKQFGACLAFRRVLLNSLVSFYSLGPSDWLGIDLTSA